MNDQLAKEILDKVVGVIFGYQNPLSLEQAKEKFAFDLRLPQQVYDSFSQQPTWASSVNPSQFISLENPRARDEWMLPKRELSSIEDIVAAWSETNYTTTDRQLDSIGIAKSDNIYRSENVYNSCDIRNSKNILFCESGDSYEYVVAGSRSSASSFCIRVEDSQLCTSSFNVIWSSKVSNSFFIQDCYDVMDCMFCSHIAGKRFCIANMQYTEEEYNRIKQQVIHWILKS
jgi:hypothetical protein